MKHPFMRSIGVMALCSLLFMQVAQATVTEDPYTDDPAITVTLSGSLNAEGQAVLSWTQYTGANFFWYKVVHSQTNPNAKYPTDSYIEVKTNSAETTYTHTEVPAGTNYYRICVITTDSKRGCSNTVTLNKTGTETTTTPPADPYTNDSSIAVTLSGSLNSGSAQLNWTTYTGTDLKWYKVVHSQTNNAPYYPNDGYIGVYSDVNTTMHIHENTPLGTNYYSVCVITQENHRGCSNTLTLSKTEASATETTASSFPDTETHWAKDYIEKLYKEGVVVGRDGNFEPDAPVLRSESIKIILLGTGLQPIVCDANIFPDLLSTDWFCGVVTKAKLLSVVEGDNGYLLPYKKVTRAEAVKMLIKAKGIEPPEVVTENPFPDVDKSAWYAKYIYKAKILGLVQGKLDGNFEPNADISRAELAKIVVLMNQ